MMRFIAAILIVILPVRVSALTVNFGATSPTTVPLGGRVTFQFDVDLAAVESVNGWELDMNGAPGTPSDFTPRSGWAQASGDGDGLGALNQSPFSPLAGPTSGAFLATVEYTFSTLGSFNLQPQLEGAGLLSGFTDGAFQPIPANNITLAGGSTVVTVIPEPESVVAAFLAAGLMGGVLWRRRLRVSLSQ